MANSNMKVYQKPTCSKCRNLLKTLKERNVSFDNVNYYVEPMTADELKDVLAKLQMQPREIMRTGEAVYKELEIGTKDYTDDELIDLMVKHPDLIQRPIVVTGDKAEIVRTQESIDRLLS